MTNLNLKGIWIPIEILEDDKLSDKEKIIYSIIIFLSKDKKYCYCTNKNFSELLGISITQVSKLINSLKDKKYITVEIDYKKDSKQVECRKLLPAKSDFNNRNRDLRRMFDKQIEKLEKENKHLHKLLDKFKETLGKFIHWICRNFSMNSDETKLVRDFEKETGNYLDPERQLIKEKREKEWDLER